MPPPHDPEKELEKRIRRLSSNRYSVYQVFGDFVEMAAISISNAVDWGPRDEREAQYRRIVKRYIKEEVNEFPKLLCELTPALERSHADILGRLYGALEIHNERAGQFFTPYTICQMMAKMTLHDVKGLLNEREFITVQEPAVGAGAMAIAVAEEFENLGLNVHTQLHITAVDVDPTCALMTYIQLSLLGVPAVVEHGNSLSLETYSTWHTPIHVLNG